MIGYLQGKIIDLDFQECIIFTQSGVGYTVLINEIIYTHLALEEETSFFIHHHKTENSEALFGFLEKSDKKVFTELIKISGIGGKVAMQILSLGVIRLITAIQNTDKKTIESIKGVGKKMAEKIILELKDKDFVVEMNTEEKEFSGNTLDQNVAGDVKNTLVTMGYNPKDVDGVLQKVPENLASVGEIIPFCIRELS
ncbi:MAG: Holliday junction branch migration protein RuvA [Candidatus Gracilibacteria bacterium]|nr:Holliday junction branch migration protein RuvA [Candidatus Gracilibacteria bacterium]